MTREGPFDQVDLELSGQVEPPYRAAAPQRPLVDIVPPQDGDVAPVGQLTDGHVASHHWEVPRPLTATPHHPEPRLTRPQWAAVVVGLALLGLGLAVRPLVTVVAVNALFLGFFTAANVLKLLLILRTLRRPDVVLDAPPDALASTPADLPGYTVLVPLFHEGVLVPQLLDGLCALEYPRDRLDVKLLVESDDDDTRNAIADAGPLPAWVEVLEVPDVGPRGKPRACNAGLARARGDFLVIYDAEDRPDPDQLLRALRAFAVAPPDVVCLQAKLNSFNRTQNLLTRWFTAEYSTWFDLLLPGLQSLGAPIPLGGTSNHFIVSRLFELGGWNAYNVTEDADLGMRIAARGWRTAVVESTTYEEATSRVPNWVRQRSRWVKGYIQTYLWHMRHPVRLLRTLGLRSFTLFHLFFGAATVCAIVNPIYWGLTVTWWGFHPAVLEEVFPAPALYVGTAGLFLGNAAMILALVGGCLWRRHDDDVKWVLLAPLYWVLMSIAAWRGLIQFIVRPYHWDKTEHGYYLLESFPYRESGAFHIVGHAPVDAVAEAAS